MRQLLSSLALTASLGACCTSSAGGERLMLACRAMCGGVDVEIHSVSGGVCKCQDRRPMYIPVTEDFN